MALFLVLWIGIKYYFFDLNINSGLPAFSSSSILMSRLFIKFLISFLTSAIFSLSSTLNLSTSKKNLDFLHLHKLFHIYLLRKYVFHFQFELKYLILSFLKFPFLFQSQKFLFRVHLNVTKLYYQNDLVYMLNKIYYLFFLTLSTDLICHLYLGLILIF